MLISNTVHDQTLLAENFKTEGGDVLTQAKWPLTGARQGVPVLAFVEVIL